jgi:hypothetical protein
MQYKLLRARGALNEGGAPASPTASLSPDEDLARRSISVAVLELIPESVAREHLVLPLALDGDVLTVATPRPHDIAPLDKLRFILNKNVQAVYASEASVKRALNAHYGQRLSESVDSMLQEFHDTAVSAGGMASQSADEDYESDDVSNLVKDLGTRRPPSSRRTRAASRLGGGGVFYYVVPEGERVLMRRPDGTAEIIVGPRRVWRGRKSFQWLEQVVAHPGEFLIVRYRDGRQEHRPGPCEVWLDPRAHEQITSQDALQLAAKEAVVVYSRDEQSGHIGRRLVFGPALFVPEPGEWLHTFSWHASKGGSRGVQKVANGLVFQKLWLMPDQMYHDVNDVRTADDAVLTIRLMIFFELLDVERMLEATHDPIGDFVNAATSDAVDFVGRYDFESFKRNTGRLNELETYRQLVGRAGQCGYRINKVVYRGYGAADSLQQMHDQAIEARTRLQLQRATEQQAQDLENYKLDAQIARAAKRRTEQTGEVDHDLDLARRRQEQELRQREAEQAQAREASRLDALARLEIRRQQEAQERERLAALREMGVDLTAFLTQHRADRVIELRGGGGTHVHLDESRKPTAPKDNGV